MRYAMVKRVKLPPKLPLKPKLYRFKGQLACPLYLSSEFQDHVRFELEEESGRYRPVLETPGGLVYLDGSNVPPSAADECMSFDD